MFGQLVPCGGGNPLPLVKSRLVVGRAGNECDVPIASGTVSSKHCLLEQRDGVWFVTDLGSRNGIRIDGVRCQEGRLPPGSVLWIAQQRFQVEYTLKGIESGSASPRASPASSPAKVVAQVRESDTTIVEPPKGPPSGIQGTARQAGSHSAGSPIPALKGGASLGELIPCGGGAPIPLTKPSLIIGRSSVCDIMLPYPMVSSKHCQLEFKSGFWHVRDLGSRNGIRVDGIFQLAKYLKPGEILSIAKHRYE